MDIVKPQITRSEIKGATLITISEMHLPLVKFICSFRSGALADDLEQAGLTHIFLEMLKRGTKKRNFSLFTRELEELGSSIESFVSNEVAFLQGTSLHRHLPATLELLADCLINPAFAEEELEVTLEETLAQLWALRDDDYELADFFLKKYLYLGERFSESALGTVNSLAKITKELLHEEHAKRLQTSELIFVFAGNLTHEEAALAIAPILEQLPAVTPPSPVVYKPLAPKKGEQLIIIDKKEREQIQLRLAALAVDGRNLAAERLWLAVMAFGGTFMSPFCQQVRELKGYAYMAFAEFSKYSRITAPLALKSSPTLLNLSDCLSLELQLYKEFTSGQLLEGDFVRAKEYVLNRYPFTVANAYMLLETALSLELLGYPLNDIFNFKERLKKYTFLEVKESITKYLDPDNVLILMVGEARKILKDLEKRFKNCEVEVVPYLEGLK